MSEARRALVGAGLLGSGNGWPGQDLEDPLPLPMGSRAEANHFVDEHHSSPLTAGFGRQAPVLLGQFHLARAEPGHDQGAASEGFKVSNGNAHALRRDVVAFKFADLEPFGGAHDTGAVQRVGLNDGRIHLEEDQGHFGIVPNTDTSRGDPGLPLHLGGGEPLLDMDFSFTLAGATGDRGGVSGEWEFLVGFLVFHNVQSVDEASATSFGRT